MTIAVMKARIETRRRAVRKAWLTALAKRLSG